MKKICIILVFLVAILVDIAYAIRISPDTVRIEFEPNLEKSITFRVGGSQKIELYKKGALADYVDLSESVVGGDSSFTVTVKLPSYIDTPGDNIVLIGAREYSGGGGTVGGVAAIQTPIVIRVPYPGIYPEFSLSAPDANIDETVPIIIRIRNLGTDKIKRAVAQIDIIDSDNLLAKKLTTNELSVESKSTVDLMAFFNTTGVKSGSYRAIANVTYDANYTLLERNFRVGILSVKLLNYTKEFLKDKIGKFEIELQSKWNSKIDDLHAEIIISNGTKTIETLKTPTTSLEPWQKIKIYTFWDTTDLAEGKYNARIILYYAGTSSTSDNEVMIFKPKESLISKYMNTTTILIALVILLVIFNMIILLKRKRKYSKEHK